MIVIIYQNYRNDFKIVKIDGVEVFSGDDVRSLVVLAHYLGHKVDVIMVSSQDYDSIFG